MLNMWVLLPIRETWVNSNPEAATRVVTDAVQTRQINPHNMGHAYMICSYEHNVACAEENNAQNDVAPRGMPHYSERHAHSRLTQ
jgi:hypothetical protein